MKTFLMYYDRYENSTTSSMLDFEHIILCHKNADKFKNISNKATVIQTDLPTGIQHNFNYALKTLEYGEWAIFLSDDLIGGRKFDEEKYDFIECPVSKVIHELKETIKKVDGVFHLAALAEGMQSGKPIESIKTNIIGSLNVLEETSDVNFVLGVSSDKVVQVSGNYGATKFLMEKLFVLIET